MRDWSNQIAWCEAHGFRWAIVGEKFYWQTNYQTAECKSNGRIACWHAQEYFDEIIHYRVVPYETDKPLAPKFDSWQEADDYIFSFNPPIHAYITLIGDEIDEETKS